MSLTFTTIQHPFRKAHQLSMNEYTLCDMIYHLSTKPKSSVPGWCYMSRDQMSKEIGVTKRTIIRILDRLIELNFLLKNQETKYLQTTEKWNKVYEFQGGEKMSPMVKKDYQIGEKMSPDSGEKMSPNNNILDITIDKREIPSENYKSLKEKSLRVFQLAGIRGVFWEKLKKANSLTEESIKTLHQLWVKEHELLGSDFNSDQHLKNSFSRYLKNAPKKEPDVWQTPKRARAGKRLSA